MGKSIRQMVRRALPEWALSTLVEMRYRKALWSEFREDRLRYMRHCLPGEVRRPSVSNRNLEGQLIKDYHRIEKGLALQTPKRPFGAAVADRIEANLAFGRHSGADAKVVVSAESAHEALQRWNGSGLISDSIAPVANVEASRGLTDVDGFFHSRHSVRDFSKAEVEDAVLTHAVSLALQSPSVCNRQAWLVRFFRGSDASRALKYQNGNSGFTDSIPVVALITVDTRLFAAPGERNQPWIEGGIFAMSLVWALHGLGLDSCMLNMSVRNDRSSALRSEFGLEDSELVIMMVAIGYGRHGHRVARSPRRNLSEVVIAPAGRGSEPCEG